MFKMLKCDVCGCEFEPIIERHYIAREPGVTGAFSTIGSHDEENLYDAFDCPKCGCQYIAKERKYRSGVIEVISDGEKEDSDDDA